MLRLGSAAIALAGLVAALAVGCGADAPTVDLGGGCTLASDCKSPLVCAFQLCHRECGSDRDCPSSALCVRTEGGGAVCQLPSEKDCERTSDCPAGQVCAVDQQCRNACRDAKDCTPGELCVGGTCASPNEVGPGGKLPQKTGESGTPCRYDSECQEPRVCRNNQCVFPCLADADCPIETSCVDHRCEAVEPVCIPNQQRFCEPCGVQKCDVDGQWSACSKEGCQGGGGAGGMGGAGGATSTSGPGPTTSSTGHASSSTGMMTTSMSSSHSSSSTGMMTTSSAGGASASSTTVSTTASVGGSGSTGTCMMCADAGVAGGAARNFCCN